MEELEQVGGHEHQIDGTEHGHSRDRLPQRPLPHISDDVEEQQRVDEHRARHRNAIGRRQVRRRLEQEQQQQHPDHQEGVHLRHIDLPGLGLAGAADIDAREQAQLHCLLGHRERAGDHGLAGDHSRRRRQQQHRPVGNLRDHVEEGVQPGLRIRQHQRALAQIVQNQRRQHQDYPGRADGSLPEVAHIRIEGLGARHGQEHAAQDDEAQEPVVGQKDSTVVRRQCPEDREVVKDVINAQRGQRQEPQRCDRPEVAGHAGRAPRLHQKQRNQNSRRNRQHVGRKGGAHAGCFADTFDRRQNGHRRRDNAVAVEQRRADHAQNKDHRGPATGTDPLRQRHQGQGSTLALVVGPHQEHDVLDGHD